MPAAQLRSNQVTLLAIGTASPPASPRNKPPPSPNPLPAPPTANAAWLHRVFSRAGVNHRGTVLKTGPGLDEIHAFYGPPKSPTTAAPPPPPA